MRFSSKQTEWVKFHIKNTPSDTLFNANEGIWTFEELSHHAI